MTVGPRDPATPHSCPPNQALEATNAWTPWTTPAHGAELSPAERVQTDYELGRAYGAAKRLQELLELAGLDAAAARARRIRAEIVESYQRIHEDDARIVGQEPPIG